MPKDRKGHAQTCPKCLEEVIEFSISGMVGTKSFNKLWSKITRRIKVKKFLLVLLVAVMVFTSVVPAFAWGDGHSGHAYYRGGHWYRGGNGWFPFLGGVVTGLVVGEIVSQPPRLQPVIVNGYQYYTDGAYYYQATPSGYVVVQPPVQQVVVQQPPQVVYVQQPPVVERVIVKEEKHEDHK